MICQKVLKKWQLPLSPKCECLTVKSSSYVGWLSFIQMAPVGHLIIGTLCRVMDYSCSVSYLTPRARVAGEMIDKTQKDRRQQFSGCFLFLPQSTLYLWGPPSFEEGCIWGSFISDHMPYETSPAMHGPSRMERNLAPLCCKLLCMLLLERIRRKKKDVDKRRYSGRARIYLLVGELRKLTGKSSSL